jgi:hypothetical protein
MELAFNRWKTCQKLVPEVRTYLPIEKPLVIINQYGVKTVYTVKTKPLIMCEFDK